MSIKCLHKVHKQTACFKQMTRVTSSEASLYASLSLTFSKSFLSPQCDDWREETYNDENCFIGTKE